MVVTGTRSDVIATPDRVSFNVANDLQVQTGTVADALRSVPGGEVDLQGRVSLRGDPGSGTFVASRRESGLDLSNSVRTARFGVEYDVDKKNRLGTELSYRAIDVDIKRTDDFVTRSAPLSYERVSDIDLSQRGLSARGSWSRTLGKEHELVADLDRRGMMRLRHGATGTGGRYLRV